MKCMLLFHPFALHVHTTTNCHNKTLTQVIIEFQSRHKYEKSKMQGGFLLRPYYIEGKRQPLGCYCFNSLTYAIFFYYGTLILILKHRSTQHSIRQDTSSKEVSSLMRIAHSDKCQIYVMIKQHCFTCNGPEFIIQR